MGASHDAREPSPVVLSIDGIEVRRLPIPAKDNAETRWTMLHFSRGMHRINLHVPDDGAPIAIKWLRLRTEEESRRQRRKRQNATDRLFAPAQDLIGEDDRRAAELVVGAFARRAWRREVKKSEIVPLIKLYDRGADRGESTRIYRAVCCDRAKPHRLGFGEFRTARRVCRLHMGGGTIGGN